VAWGSRSLQSNAEDQQIDRRAFTELAINKNHVLARECGAPGWDICRRAGQHTESLSTFPLDLHALLVKLLPVVECCDPFPPVASSSDEL